MVGIELVEIEALYRQRQHHFFRVALALLNGDRERANDAVQETFARAIRARDGFRAEGPPEAWLWRTLTNVCLREGRQRLVAVERIEDAAAEVPSNDQGIREAVAQLPERQRLILFLRHYADLDYDAIAGITGVARGTVAATLNAAHSALRKALTEACHD